MRAAAATSCILLYSTLYLLKSTRPIPNGVVKPQTASPHHNTETHTCTIQQTIPLKSTLPIRSEVGNVTCILSVLLLVLRGLVVKHVVPSFLLVAHIAPRVCDKKEAWYNVLNHKPTRNHHKYRRYIGQVAYLASCWESGLQRKGLLYSTGVGFCVVMG